MKTAVPNINYFWATLLMEELYRCGVRSIGIAPGSRSSPLAEAAASHGRLNIFVYPDERILGFRMLGEAKASGRPTVVVTTSGTAATNLFPAVAEASHSGIPLIAITADRPPELRDCGANQATDQVKLFGAFVRFFADLPVPTSEIAPAFVLSTADAAVRAAMGAAPGPVHLNAMFREPLAPTERAFPQRKLARALGDWPDSDQPWIAHESVGAAVECAEAVVEKIAKAKRGIILAGALTPGAARAVEALAAHLNWPLLPDIQSGLRLGVRADAVISHADALLASEHFASGADCDLLLQFGSRFVTRRFLALAGNERIRERMIVDDAPGRMDPAHRSGLRISSAPAAIAEALRFASAPRASTDWLAPWAQASALVEREWASKVAKSKEISEPAIASTLSSLLEEGDAWFLGNSLPIRLAATFASARGAPVHVAANRGLSGIDGQIATAVGYAAGRGRSVTLMLGDLSALHDLGSFALLRTAKTPVIVVVVNNDGGGIFSLLPIAESARHFENVFAAPHGVEFSKAAEMFGVAYAAPKSLAAFTRAWRAARQSGRSAVIEVRTRRADTASEVRKRIAEIAQKLDRLRK